MKPVTDILRDYRKGQLVEDASEALQEVVRSVLETGKPAEMAIILKVKLNKGDTSLVIVSGEVKAKVAKEALPDAIFYADSTGDLHRSDPKQQDMLLTEVVPDGRRQA